MNSSKQPSEVERRKHNPTHWPHVPMLYHLFAEHDLLTIHILQCLVSRPLTLIPKVECASAEIQVKKVTQHH